MPQPEVEITLDLVKKLLGEQHPDLVSLPLLEVSRGWDNTMFRLGEGLAVRLPHRSLAEALLLSEQRWLSLLADRLPMPVPVPVRTGQATDYYPWAWSVVPWFEGTPIGISPDLDGEQAATDMGRFLAALHQPADADAPINTGRGVPLAERHQMTIDRIAALEGRVDCAALRARWQHYLDLPPWEGPPLWLHADLHPLNVLQHERRISAIIDFGDITSGDPATDLAIAYSILEPRYHEVFRHAAHNPVRPIDDDMWERAAGWAMSVGLAIVNSSADSPLMYQVGMQMIG